MRALQACLVLAVMVVGCGQAADEPPWALAPGRQPPAGEPLPQAQPRTEHWQWSECGSMALPQDTSDVGGPEAGVREVLGVSIAPDGATVVTTDGYHARAFGIAPRFEDSAMRWDANTELEFASEFSSDGSLLAISGDGRGLIESDGGEVVFSLAPPPGVHFGCGVAYFGLSHDGRWAAGGGYDYGVEVYDIVTRRLVTTLPSSSCNSAAAFSPDDSLLATGRGELYRTSDWSRVWPDEVERDTSSEEVWLTGVQFTSDGQYILISRCSYPRTATSCQYGFHQVASGALALGHLASATFPALSPDGSWLATDGHLSHRATGARHTLQADLGATAFMPNGDVIAAGADHRLHRFCVQK